MPTSRSPAKGCAFAIPQGVSSLADATLHLQGPQNNLLLSGDVLITRFSVSPDLDLAALAAQASTRSQTIAPPDAPSNHIRLDVHIVSSPQLNFQNAFAKLAGNVDLRLRGTLASPSLLGRVSITEGSAMIAGTRYELERGDITFTNPVRIEPTIDLSATARVEDYDITLGLHGTPQKLGRHLPQRSSAARGRRGRAAGPRPHRQPAAPLHPAAGAGPRQSHHRRPARRRPQRHRQQPRAKALRRRLASKSTPTTSAPSATPPRASSSRSSWAATSPSPTPPT